MSATAKIYVTENNEPIHGILAEFETPADLYHAAEKVRDAGYKKWDTHSPFPIHGMEDAMGIKRTILPVLVAGGGFTGATLGYLMQWWMSHDYKLVVQGKPWGHFVDGGWEPFVPIIFELGILFSAFTAIIGMLAMNGLPRWHHPLLKKSRFLRSSQDKFFVSIEACDPSFDPVKTRQLLEQAGARSIELVED
jgi:hypothetical protein